jgi:carboxypeptidase family protein
VNNDFTFDVKTTPGPMAMRAFAPGWQVKAVRINGTDMTDSNLDVGAQGVSGVDIEMTNRLQEISGGVTDADGKPVKDYAVVMFAQDRSRWVAAFNRYGLTARSDSDGRFKATTLPAGEYYAIALDHSDAVEGQDPEFLESLTRLATPVSLAPGDKRTLDLKLFTVQ